MPERSTATWASSTPSPASTSTRGFTSASRAVDQRSIATGRQGPLVTAVSPQSQPKFDAVLRT